MRYIFVLLFSTNALGWDLSGIAPYVHFHDRIVTELADKTFRDKWRLSRYDADLALDVNGNVGIFGAGASAGVELIWQRSEKKTSQEETLDITLDPSDKSQTANALLELMTPILELHRFSDRRIKRFARYLAEDAEIIHAFHETLAATPASGNWRITGFFKIYEFSTGLELGPIGGEYEKRIRIRFSVKPRSEYEYQKAVLFPTAAKLRRVLNELSALTNSPEIQDDSFRLSRVWMRSDIVVGFDLGFFEKNVTKGLVIQFQRIKSQKAESTKHVFLPKLPEKLILPPSLRADFPLSQVRLRLSGTIDRELTISTLENESTIDAHYMKEVP